MQRLRRKEAETVALRTGTFDSSLGVVDFSSSTSHTYTRTPLPPSPPPRCNRHRHITQSLPLSQKVQTFELWSTALAPSESPQCLQICIDTPRLAHRESYSLLRRRCGQGIDTTTESSLLEDPAPLSRSLPSQALSLLHRFTCSAVRPTRTISPSVGSAGQNCPGTIHFAQLFFTFPHSPLPVNGLIYRRFSQKKRTSWLPE